LTEHTSSLRTCWKLLLLLLLLVDSLERMLWLTSNVLLLLGLLLPLVDANRRDCLML